MHLYVFFYFGKDGMMLSRVVFPYVYLSVRVNSFCRRFRNYRCIYVMYGFVMIPVVLSRVIGCDRRQIGTRCVKDGIIGRKVM